MPSTSVTRKRFSSLRASGERMRRGQRHDPHLGLNAAVRTDAAAADLLQHLAVFERLARRSRTRSRSECLAIHSGDSATPNASRTRIESLSAASWPSTSAAGSASAKPSSCAFVSASSKLQPSREPAEQIIAGAVHHALDGRLPSRQAAEASRAPARRRRPLPRNASSPPLRAAQAWSGSQCLATAALLAVTTCAPGAGVVHGVATRHRRRRSARRRYRDRRRAPRRGSVVKRRVFARGARDGGPAPGRPRTGPAAACSNSSTPAPTEPQPSKATLSRSGRAGLALTGGHACDGGGFGRAERGDLDREHPRSSAAWIALAWISPLLACSASA